MTAPEGVMRAGYVAGVRKKKGNGVVGVWWGFLAGGSTPTPAFPRIFAPAYPRRTRVDQICQAYAPRMPATTT